jgi:hypothetical protein
MSEHPLRVDGTFDDEILEDRRSLVARLEEIAGRASTFRNNQSGGSNGTIPLVTVGVIDAVRMVSEAPSNGAIEMSQQEFRDVLERSGVKTSHLLDNQVEAARIATNKAVGVAFELDLPELIRSGQVPVPFGTDTVTLHAFNHPGSDLAFAGSDGNVIIEANAKASMSWDVIREHFQSHPDVSIVYTTHEAAVSAAANGMTVFEGANVVIPPGSGHVVVDTGMTAAGYREAILEAAGHDDHGLFDFLNSHHLFNEVPWFTIMLLAYRARKRGKEGMPWIENRVRTTREASRSGAALVAALALQNFGVPIPVTFASSFFSAAIVQGAFNVRDEWGFMAAYEDSLAQRTTRLAEV